jgi:hypothetical protein
VAAKAEEHRPAVGQHMRRACERLAAMTRAVDSIAEVEAQLAAQSEAVQAEVQQRFDHIVEVLKRRKEEVMVECRQVASDKNGVLVTQRESLQAIVDSMQRSHDMTQETVDRIDERPGQFLFYKHELVSVLEGVQGNEPVLEPQESSRIAFQDSDAIVVAVAAFGGIDGSTTMAANCVAEGDGLEKAGRGKEATFSVRASDYQDQPRTEGGDRVEMSIVLIDDAGGEGKGNDGGEGAAGGGGGGDGGEGKEGGPTVPDYAWAAGGAAGGAAAAEGAVPLAQEAVVDNGDGTYAVAYTISEEFEGGEGQRGPLKAHLQVTVNGAAIAGSPFELEINMNRGPKPQCRNFVCDPAKKSGHIQLSNGGRTTTGGYGGTHGTVIGTESMSAGKNYWEISIDTMSGTVDSSGSHVTLGIATPQLNNYHSIVPESDKANMVGGYDTGMDGGKAYGVQSKFAPALTKNWNVGDVLGLCLDLDARELSLFINKEFQGKTPVGAGTYYPAFSCYSSNDKVTILHDVELPAALQ